MIRIKNLKKIEENKSWFSKSVEKEMNDTMEYSERVGGTVIFVLGVLGVLYFVAHQIWSTGFFTAKFSTLEMILFYGYLIVVMVSGALYGLFGRKHLSRYFDVFGGMIFAAVAITWLLMVFPFDFAYFADVLPDFLRFLVQWFSNDIARVLMVLGILVHLVGQVWMGLLFVFVRKARARESPKKSSYNQGTSQQNLTISEQIKNGGRVYGE